MRAIDTISNIEDIKKLVAARKRAEYGEERAIAERILREVRECGDEAVVRLNQQFSPASPKMLRVSEGELTGAVVSSGFEQSVIQASRNIRAFHTLQRPKEIQFSPAQGIECRRVPQGLSRVGLYVPGGDTPLISTLLMLAIPAQVAGCKEIAVCSPAGSSGRISDELLWTLQYLGITEVYVVGGAQAIAALAYGTETIQAVAKIAGPGSQFVNQAKLLIQQQGVCSIDIPAGPSELIAVVDRGVNPSFVAADLLSQAEHGKDSFTAVVASDMETLDEIKREMQLQLSLRSRQSILKDTVAETRFLLSASRDNTLSLLNALAPEHILLAGENAESYINEITSVGTIFVGEYTPESLGDYLSGMNHVLPTGTGAKGCSGVSVETFTKWIGIQRSTKEGLATVANSIMTLAKAEQLDGHAYAVEIRL